jgi:hypothetical protein
MDGGAGREPGADPAAVDAVLTASRSMVAVATRSLGAAAEETHDRAVPALVVLASRGPRRIADLAEALDVAPSTAGRMGDRLVRKGLVRRHRARGDRRVVLVSVTPAGRQVADGRAPRPGTRAAPASPAQPGGQGQPTPPARGSSNVKEQA